MRLLGWVYTLKTVPDASAYKFTPRWKEELVCESASGQLVLEMIISKPTVYFPTDSRWNELAPDWAKERRSEILQALQQWSTSQDIQIVVDDKAWVAQQ
jgi:hypothetical protein